MREMEKELEEHTERESERGREKERESERERERESENILCFVLLSMLYPRQRAVSAVVFPFHPGLSRCDWLSGICPWAPSSIN